MATQIRFLSGLKRIPRKRPPTLIVEKTWSVFVSITVIVPSRSLVTNASGPEDFEVHPATKKRLNHKGAKALISITLCLSALAVNVFLASLMTDCCVVIQAPAIRFLAVPHANPIHGANRQRALVPRSSKPDLREST